MTPGVDGAVGAGVGEVLWAHHAALVAIPAFVPAIIVVAVVLHIARKDREDERRENELLRRAFEDEPHDPRPSPPEASGPADASDTPPDDEERS